MAQTLIQIQHQIEKLQSHAERLRKAEAAGVIARMKVAIEAYGIGPDDLFGAKSAKSAKKATAVSAGKPLAKYKSKSKLSSKAQFADGTGNEWVGRGPRPAWLREALASGKTLSDFAVRQRKAKVDKAAPNVVAGKRGKGKHKAVAIKYRDAEGNTWTGRGSQPRWLKAAVAAGKSAEQFSV